MLNSTISRSIYWKNYWQNKVDPGRSAGSTFRDSFTIGQMPSKYFASNSPFAPLLNVSKTQLQYLDDTQMVSFGKLMDEGHQIRRQIGKWHAILSLAPVLHRTANLHNGGHTAKLRRSFKNGFSCLVEDQVRFAIETSNRKDPARRVGRHPPPWIPPELKLAWGTSSGT